ncbi:hypothetical protein DFH94DRAFT_679547 [Russula ochroleuca]|uniref:Complex 1 LYR protein n=1 Tax=Russula ochroleuca TaxID=152965 RepID=A0A9P5N331_9AGAM|nr:hypothetical protein DFH94DRAFT_679547 [Russula ochroleuca]
MATKRAYRAILRELYKASISPRSTRSRTTALNFRAVLESTKSSDFDVVTQNNITFLRSQRMYKTLLDRYNPLVDLTAEERIEATARRVGLNMPITSQDNKAE